MAERVRQRVLDADISHLDSPGGRMSISVGVATRLSEDRGIDAMLQRADAALYLSLIHI